MNKAMRTATALLAAGVLALLLPACAGASQAAKKTARKADPYADYVWPPPPDEPRIKLETVIRGRADVEAGSRFRQRILEAAAGPYDRLRKPFAVAFDNEGRILVTESARRAVIRFDRAGRKMDVLGTKGPVTLRVPLGLDVGPDGTIYVADVGLKKVVAYETEGGVKAVYGREGELMNPTDAALSPDGSRLFVADSKAHKILVFDHATAAIVSTFGERGFGEGAFNFPTSLAFGPEGNLFVVDQMNSRVLVLTPDGEYLDEFGQLGVGFSNFVRPKDVAVDETGFIYVTDNAFNNVQLFDADFTLLTFVGSGGREPGQFWGASGIDVRGDEFAVVDQLGARVQVFRFIVPKDR